MSEWVRQHMAFSKALALAFVGEMSAVTREALDRSAPVLRRRVLKHHQLELARHARGYAERLDLWTRIEREEVGR